MLVLETPHGPARAHLRCADGAAAALVLGHGAGGSVTTPDLVAVKDVALGAGVSVALVEQPYRVAGRRAPPPAHQLDAAWRACVEQVLAGAFRGLPLVVGGRSSGARVACRTAAATGARAVLCLAFPLQPPRRSSGTAGSSRQPELDAVDLPTLVVQGERDAFGMPREAANRRVVAVPGDHRLRADVHRVAAEVGDWLVGVLA